MANHPQLQRMMLITLNIVCMSLSRICKAFGVNHVGRIFCIAELTTCHFDVLLICETRRGEKIRVPSRKKVSTPILAVVPFIRALEFAYRLILLHIFSFFFSCIFQTDLQLTFFSVASRRFRGFSVYFPTAWDADGAVEQMYDVLNLLVNACVEAGDIPIVGGNFKACLGSADTDDFTFLQHVHRLAWDKRIQETQC